MSHDPAARAARLAAARRPDADAVEILADGRLEVVERTARRLLVEVESRSSPGRLRRVTSEAGRLACDCPAFHHGHRCAHVAAAALVVAEPGLRRLRPGCSEPGGEALW